VKSEARISIVAHVQFEDSDELEMTANAVNRAAAGYDSPTTTDIHMLTQLSQHLGDASRDAQNLRDRVASAGLL
jgi:hypothetical protein